MTKLEELRAAAEAEFAQNKLQEIVPEVAESPDDSVITSSEENISDAPVETPIETPEEQPEPKRGPWRQVIDLGDGSGVQVFEALTKDELIAKLVKAQENATRKIKELNQKVKKAVQPETRKPLSKFEPKELSPDEQFTLSQELQTNPTGAVAKLFKATVGATPEEIREALQEAREANQARKAQLEGQKFVTTHPEYVNTAENEKAMLEYLQKNNMAFTKTNLEIAFDDLVEAGLVSPKTEKEEVPAPKPQREVVHRRAHVGLSPRSSSADDVEQEPHEPTVEEMRKLSPEERRRIVLRSMRR